MANKEYTSDRVATIAAKIMVIGYAPTNIELRSMAASLLTQARDKKAIIAKVKGNLSQEVKKSVRGRKR